MLENKKNYKENDMRNCNNPDCKCENCQCGDNCQCGKDGECKCPNCEDKKVQEEKPAKKRCCCRKKEQ